MLSYAFSNRIWRGLMTPPVADALRTAKLRNLEILLDPYIEDTPEARLSREITGNLIREKIIRAGSVHLPYHGGGVSWDPSSPDENERRASAARLIALLRATAGLNAPLATLHASGEPPDAEHPVRLDQVCRTLEELMPAAQELDLCINVEYLPRSCVGNCARELQTIVSRFDPRHVGIVMDVNHVMRHAGELPEIIAALAARIRAFHLSDYDGVDEKHWFPGQGIIDWPATMRAIRRIDRAPLLILETGPLPGRGGCPAAPIFNIRQLENAVWFLENCETVVPMQRDFRIPGQDGLL